MWKKRLTDNYSENEQKNEENNFKFKKMRSKLTIGRATLNVTVGLTDEGQQQSTTLRRDARIQTKRNGNISTNGEKTCFRKLRKSTPKVFSNKLLLYVCAMFYIYFVLFSRRCYSPVGLLEFYVMVGCLLVWLFFPYDFRVSEPK